MLGVRQWIADVVAPPSMFLVTFSVCCCVADLRRYFAHVFNVLKVFSRRFCLDDAAAGGEHLQTGDDRHCQDTTNSTTDVGDWLEITDSTGQWPTWNTLYIG